jgi:hypothetical protein
MRGELELEIALECFPDIVANHAPPSAAWTIWRSVIALPMQMYISLGSLDG